MTMYGIDVVTNENRLVSYTLAGTGVYYRKLMPYRWGKNQNAWVNISHLCSPAAIRAGIRRGTIAFK